MRCCRIYGPVSARKNYCHFFLLKPLCAIRILTRVFKFMLWFSNINIHYNPLESMLKHRLLRFTLRVSIPQVWGGASASDFLTKSNKKILMLLVQGQHFENYCDDSREEKKCLISMLTCVSSDLLWQLWSVHCIRQLIMSCLLTSLLSAWMLFTYFVGIMFKNQAGREASSGPTSGRKRRKIQSQTEAGKG